MPRSNLSQKTIGKTSASAMWNALHSIKNGGLSVKAASMKYNIPRTTLRRYVKKCENREIDWEDPTAEGIPRLTPNYSVNKIFSSEEEEILSDYLQTLAKLHHGLTPKNVRKLAYELAVVNHKKIPESWHSNKMAGKFWLTHFLKRNPLSIRSAESTSLGRAMAFNKPVVTRFYKNLKEVLDKYKFRSDKIYNMDETSLTTVQDCTKIIAKKGQKQVGQISSSERGTLVTMCGAINADGNSIPPMLIFPRKYFKAHMLKGAPNGTIGTTSPNGWITTELFIHWLKHFISYTNPTPEMPVLLIMDNHNSHLSLGVIRLARESNVVLLTLPPHTSHKIQPLDVSVYGPLKSYYNNACQTWLTNHPGQRITIYDIAEILGSVYHLAFSPRNCTSGFRATGIYPFNDNIFNDDDFMAASVTDVPLVVEADKECMSPTEPQASCSYSNQTSSIREVMQPVTPVKQFVSPEIVKPFPKSTMTQKKLTKRKKRSTEILTSTPILKQLEDQEAMRLNHQENEQKKKVRRRIDDDECVTERPRKNNYPAKQQVKRNKVSVSSDDFEDSNPSENDLSLPSSNDIDWYEDPMQDDDITNLDNIAVDSFVLVKFPTKKSVKYYVGKILEICSCEFNVSFLRKQGKNFLFPTIPDISMVRFDDIVMHLPKPSSTGGTARTQSVHKFPVDFSRFSIS